VWCRGIQRGIPCTRPGQLSERLATASAGELTHGTRPLDDATVYGAAAAALALLERGGIAHLAFSEWLHTAAECAETTVHGDDDPSDEARRGAAEPEQRRDEVVWLAERRARRLRP